LAIAFRDDARHVRAPRAVAAAVRPAQALRTTRDCAGDDLSG
jgi:hypothetical protein